MARKVVYPKKEIKICEGKDGLDYATVQKLLGWAEAGKNEEALFTDEYGKKIVCKNNRKNRPFYVNLALGYAQDVLNRVWSLNFQNRIIGKYGSVISGQHSLIGYCLAVQMWRQNKALYPKWKSEPKLETTIGFGCEETEDVFRSIDIGKPQSVSDVVYRCEFFEGLPSRDRRIASRRLEHAVNLLWKRTGVPTTGKLQTMAESIEFIHRHPKLIKSVTHIYEEDGEGHISKILSPGYSSAMLYLMACSNSDSDEYYSDSTHGEDTLNWDNEDKAEEYFVAIGNKSPEVSSIPKALQAIRDEDETPSSDERVALIALGWLAFVKKGKVSPGDLTLEYEGSIEEGDRHLIEHPTVGGIDLGKEAPSISSDPEVTPEEIAAEKEKIRNENNAKKKGTGTKAKKKTVTPRKRKAPEWKEGDHVWYNDPDNGPWDGVILEVSPNFAKVEDGDGTVVELEKCDLLEEQPT